MPNAPMPRSGRAPPFLRRAWTRNKQKHKLKPVPRLTLHVDQKVEPGHVSPAERALLEIVVDFYKAGSLMGIEDYSGGCSYPKDRLKQTLEKYKSHARPASSETFVFTMFFGNTEEFIKQHQIPVDWPNADPEETAAKYITKIARNIPNSEAFCGTGKDDGVGFGFTLSGKAARA